MNVFETVKAVVPMRQAAERYGLQINRGGMVCCPFHQDRYPSLKLNEDYFYCFGCGASGDVINFVSRLFGLSLYEAAMKLAADFGIDTGRSSPSAARRADRRKDAQTILEQERQCVSVLTDYLWLLRDWKAQYTPLFPNAPFQDRYVEACYRMDYVEYLLDELIAADKTEKASIVAMLTTDNKLENLKQHIKRMRMEDVRYECGRNCEIAV